MALIITSEIPTSAGVTNQAFLIIEKTSYAIDQLALRYGTDTLSVSTRLYLNKESWESDPTSSCVSNSVLESFSFQGGASPDILFPLKDSIPLLEACYDLVKQELEAIGLNVEYGDDTDARISEKMRDWREGNKKDIANAKQRETDRLVALNEAAEREARESLEAAQAKKDAEAEQAAIDAEVAKKAEAEAEKEKAEAEQAKKDKEDSNEGYA